MSVPSAKAHGRSPDEDENATGFRFTIDGALTWMGTWGNDVTVGQTIAIDERFDRETGTDVTDVSASSLITEMRNRGVPWARAGFEKAKWGVSAEFWTLDTAGSTAAGDEPIEGLRYQDLALRSEGVPVNLRAANELSVWATRVMLLREVSKSLTVGVGLHAANLENRRDENLDLSGTSFIFNIAGNLKTRSRQQGTLFGPSVELRGSGSIHRRAGVKFTAAQSVLFGRLDNETVWQSAVTLEGLFDVNTLERLTFDSSTRVAVPVTDLRVILSCDLGSHVSVGVLGLLSVWLDAPVALEFSRATDGWDPVRSTLVFASLGPVVSVRF